MPEAAQVELVRITNADANRMGITTVFIPGAVEERLPRWAQVQHEGGLTLRANLALSADFVHDTRIPPSSRSAIAALEDYRRYAGGLISVSSVKIYCDGVMEYPAQTAAMLAPYRVNAGTREHPDWRPGTARGPDPACRGREARLRRARQGRLADPRARDRRPRDA